MQKEFEKNKPVLLTTFLKPFFKIPLCCLLFITSQILSPISIFAAQTDFNVPTGSKKWFASWCSHPQSSRTNYEILHFRRSFDLDNIPNSFKINVSADNRFRLFVNGKSVAVGPARGDLEHWRFDSLNIAPFLKKGKNTLAAIVWNYANSAPAAQISCQTAFILDGVSKTEEFIATPDNWKVKKSTAFSTPAAGGFKGAGNFSFTGACDMIDAAKFDWGWQLPDFDDSKWPHAKKIATAMTFSSTFGENTGWSLLERETPQLEEKLQRLCKIRKTEGVNSDADFINGKKFTVPANTKCSFLIDNSTLTNAYPHIITSRGKGASVKIAYAEALFDSKGKKGDRNSIENRTFSANVPFDVFLPDGGNSRNFSTLWFRTYRYVSIDIQTSSEPLVIEDFYGVFTGYPFKENASFASSDASIADIWNVGWRTARLCAVETFFDCPYYEQLQYVGDTRIQALISLYVSGDDRLMRQAIANFDFSRGSNGLVKSRYPSRIKQYIPPFALYWVSMLDDFAKHRNDDNFVADHIDGVRSVFGWYLKQIDPKTGMLRPQLPHWNFVDWTYAPEWNTGYAPEPKNSASAINSLHLAYTLKHAANLMQHMGFNREADEYSQKSRDIAAAVKKTCYDKSRGLFMNYAGAKRSSQHANIMAILADAIEPTMQRKLFDKIISDKSLDKCTFYYRFYLMEAMRKVGAGDLYVSQLAPWRNMINIGLTTFAEKPEPTRSDCHAWSSSPNYHLLSLVCGLTPAEYGFKSVRIEPNLGSLDFIDAKIPHPQGVIAITLKRNNKNISGRINLPAKLSGTFINGNLQIPLSAGENIIK